GRGDVRPPRQVVVPYVRHLAVLGSPTRDMVLRHDGTADGPDRWRRRANADPILHPRQREGQDGTHGVSAVSACLGPHQPLRGRWTPPRLRLPSTPRRRYPDPNGIDPAITGEPREEQPPPARGLVQ